MNSEAAHPSAEELAAFNLGQLAPQKADQIEHHIGRCSPCCATLLELSTDDTFVALLRKARYFDTALTVDQDSDSSDSACEDHPGLPQQLLRHPRYEVIALVGKGGMGNVFRAKHRMMERTVALKVINQKLVQREEAIERFQREVKAAARLTHPNIVTAYDAEQEGDHHFLVMEYVDGVDLARMVQECGPLPIGEACEYIRQAAMGLQHAHEHGMVHRDIKPHNLMVASGSAPESDGQTDKWRNYPTVKILDFGLASLAAEPISRGDVDCGGEGLTMVGAVMGTPDFISPEQAEDARSADIRSDIYSLGATLFYLLAARPPFTEGDLLQKLKSRGQSVAEPITTFRDDVPNELSDIISRMMSKDPAERYQTPIEVADILAAFIDDHGRAGTVHAMPRLSSRLWNRSALKIATLAACVALLATVVFIVTDRGTLEVRTEDESVAVRVHPPSHSVATGDHDGAGGAELEIVDTLTGSEVKRLRSGTYEVSLVPESRNEFELSRKRFTLRRGDKVIVKVSRKADSRLVGKARPTQVASPETEQALMDLLQSAASATSDEEWRGIILGHVPILHDLPLDVGRDLIQMLTDLPQPLRRSLLSQGYLKWKISELDSFRQAVIRDVLDALFSRHPGNNSPSDIARRVEDWLAGSDVGFKVLQLPDSEQQAIAWYSLDRSTGTPVILSLSTTSRGRASALIDPETRDQVSALRDGPYTELPPGPVATARTSEALEALLNAIPTSSEAEPWRKFLEQHSDPLIDFPVDVSRSIVELFAGLPDRSHRELMRSGYLKWKFNALAETRQEPMRFILKEMILLGLSHANADTSMAVRMTQMLEAADVGFAVLDHEGTNKQAVVWYALVPHSPMPIMVPVYGGAAGDQSRFFSGSVYRQLGNLEEKPYSALP